MAAYNIDAATLDRMLAILIVGELGSVSHPAAQTAAKLAAERFATGFEIPEAVVADALARFGRRAARPPAA